MKKVNFFYLIDILKISGKIIQKSRALLREKLIEIFDKIYSIVNKYRKIFKSIEDLELIEKEKSNLLNYFRQTRQSIVSNTLQIYLKNTTFYYVEKDNKRNKKSNYKR